MDPIPYQEALLLYILSMGCAAMNIYGKSILSYETVGYIGGFHDCIETRVAVRGMYPHRPYGSVFLQKGRAIDPSSLI